MMMPILAPQQIQQLSQLVAQYVLAQRETWLPRAVPLSEAQREAMAPFFSRESLETTRLLVLDGERIANPSFYPALQAAGFGNLPDHSMAQAIIFADCVVAHVHFTEPLLFHELVHVEQYRQLGIPRFAELYLRGFLSGGGYDCIPLERNAYALGDRYEKDPTRAFSVAEEVASWVAQGLF